MTTSISPTKRRAQSAFTLMELMVTITIISILLGMLISTVRAVRRYSRQTITRSELKNIEAAWKQFYAHYQYWPTADNIDGYWPQAQNGDGDTRFELKADLAQMLAGKELASVNDESDLETYNPDKIAFLEFGRFDKDGNPLNAWGTERTIKVTGKEPNTYVIVFDTDGDNQVTVELPGEPATNIYRAVVVWTENPEYIEHKEDRRAPEGPPRYFGSWME